MKMRKQEIEQVMTLMFVCVWIGTNEHLAPYEAAQVDALTDAVRQMGGPLTMASEGACLAAVEHHRKRQWVMWAADKDVDPYIFDPGNTLMWAADKDKNPYIFDPARNCGKWVPPSSLELAAMFLANLKEK